MARVDKAGTDMAMSVGSENAQSVQIAHIEAGGASTFGILAMDVNDSNGDPTTYYYWPNTSGALRYGTTKPTIATQDTAGAAV